MLNHRSAALLILITLVANVPAEDPKPKAVPRWKLTNFKATLRKDPVLIFERSTYVRYQAAPFIANATLTVAPPKDQTILFGFIQQVDAVENRQSYSKADTLFEHKKFPVSDAASSKLAPWYTIDTGRAIVNGGRSVTVTLEMDDSIAGNVSWTEPTPPKVEARKFADLRHIKRDQKFTAWLVAMRESDKKIAVLRKVSWRMEVDITVDPMQPIGSRCKVNPVPNHAPEISDGKGESIPTQALEGPTANEGQELWWRPASGEPVKLR